MKIQEAVTRFLREHESEHHTIKTYKSVLLTMSKALGDARPLRNVTVMDLKDYTYEMRQKKARGRDTLINPRTVAHYENVIKIFFNWSVKCELIKKSPATALKGGTRFATSATNKAFTQQEIDKMLDFAKWDKRLYALLLFLSHTGCRAGGAAMLCERDVNFETCEALVTEKGNKTRTVLFGPACRAALEEWLNTRKKRIGRVRRPEHGVFSRDGGVIQSRAITKLVKRATVGAGVRPLGAHAIRHFFGHSMAMKGVPASLTAAFMGHVNPVITLRVYYPQDLDSGKALWREYVGAESPIVEKVEEVVEASDSGKIIKVDFRKSV